MLINNVIYETDIPKLKSSYFKQATWKNDVAMYSNNNLVNLFFETCAYKAVSFAFGDKFAFSKVNFNKTFMVFNIISVMYIINQLRRKKVIKIGSI